MGSCSTGIAAIDAGVEFIGVEAAERWFDLSVDRVSAFWSTREAEAGRIPA